MNDPRVVCFSFLVTVVCVFTDLATMKVCEDIEQGEGFCEHIGYGFEK